MKLFIGSSSYETIPKKYFDDCRAYLSELFKSDNDLVFGACSDGLMGLCYDVAKENGRMITGITPEFYKDDLSKLECDTEIITENISKRNESLIENADSIIFLPGGVGTVYEIFAAIESKRAHEFDKPIVIYNSSNFYDKLESFLKESYDDTFISDETYKSFYISHSAEDTLRYLKNY